jgi:hypothetical protein
MRPVPGAETFESDVIKDMHMAFDAACAKLGLAPTVDNATELVATKVVELAKAGFRGDNLTAAAITFFESGSSSGPVPGS